MRPERRAQRIADDDGLPAQIGHRLIERFGEIRSGDVCGKQDIGTDRRVEKRFRDMPGRPRDSGPDQISGERLRGAGVIGLRVVRLSKGP